MSYNLLALFEQEAATRAHKAHMIMGLAIVHPNGHILTDTDCARINKTRIQYEYEERRHELWLKRRLKAAGIDLT